MSSEGVFICAKHLILGVFVSKFSSNLNFIPLSMLVLLLVWLDSQLLMCRVMDGILLYSRFAAIYVRYILHVRHRRGGGGSGVEIIWFDFSQMPWSVNDYYPPQSNTNTSRIKFGVILPVRRTSQRSRWPCNVYTGGEARQLVEARWRARATNVYCTYPHMEWIRPTKWVFFR